MILRLLLVLVMLPVLLPAALAVALGVCGRFVVHGSGLGSPYYRTSATPSPQELHESAARYDMDEQTYRARRSAQN